jgi:hypothetical protein
MSPSSSLDGAPPSAPLGRRSMGRVGSPDSSRCHSTPRRELSVASVNSGGGAYRRGLADKVLVSHTPEGPQAFLGASTSDTELNRSALFKIGVPATAVDIFGCRKKIQEMRHALSGFGENATQLRYLLFRAKSLEHVGSAGFSVGKFQVLQSTFK